MSAARRPVADGASALAPGDRLVVLANTRSTRYPADLDRLLDPLRERFRVGLEAVERPETFSDRIRAAAPRADALVVASGDGTVARSARELIDAGRPVGLVPIGNANDLARGLGLPTDPAEACALLLDARPAPVDVGLVNGRHFFSAATLGLGARISATMDARSKRRWGRLSQLPGVVSAFRRRRAFRVALEIDGRTHRLRSLHVTVGNGRTIGGGIVIEEQARLDDALLDVSSVRPQSLLSLFTLAPDFWRGRRRGHPRIDTFRARAFRLSTPRPMPIATDGDVVTETPAEFRTLPGAVRFLVPAAPRSTIALGSGSIGGEADGGPPGEGRARGTGGAAKGEGGA